MALKLDDNLKKVGPQAKPEAPKAAPAPAPAPEATEPKVAQAEATVEAPSDDVLESMCENIEFMASLGDPSNEDRTTKKGPDGKDELVITPTIVGYQFKALVDMEVPDCGLTIGFKKNGMDYDPDKMQNKRTVKAGELFNLTPFETALLLSAPEFNGKVLGGDKPLTLVYNKKNVTRKDGTIVTISDATNFPRAMLRGERGKSIRDYPIIKILTFEVKAAANGSKIKERKIVEGYEKWDVLCQRSVKTPSGTRNISSDAGKKKYHDGANVFMSIYNAKVKASGAK